MTYNTDTNFEKKLIVNACFILSVILAVATIFNLFIELSIIVPLTTGLGSFAFLLLYFFSKKNKSFNLIRITVTAFTFILINTAWYFNNGSKGPVLGVFIILFCFFIFIWNKKALLPISAIIFVNVSILFLIELKYPGITADYTSNSTRIIDTYIGIYISLIIIYAFSTYSKNSYQKKYLEAKRSDELKTAFLSNMSHEIRTPLNAITGFSKLLPSTFYDKKRLEGFTNLINKNR